MRKTYTTAIIAVAILAGVALPHVAHAISPLDFIGVSGVVRNVIGEILNSISWVLATGVSWLGGILQAIINVNLGAGGDVVYTIWSILRDFCNMAFIVVLILISFATIFNSWEIGFLKPYSIHSRGVISGFLIAAILLNFSLAIGQAVTGVSNRVTHIILGILPANIGTAVYSSVPGFTQIIVNSGAPQPQPIIANVPPAGLNERQRAAFESFTPVIQKEFIDCMNRNEIGCVESGALKMLNNRFSGTIQTATTALDIVSGRFLINGVIRGLTEGEGVGMTMILNKIYEIFLLLVIFTSFLVVFVFMFIRIPMVWILLALSPLAWTASAFPGSDIFSKWWKQFWAWNLFSPMYLLVIYFGLLMLNQMRRLTASLGGADVPIMASVQSFMAYFIIGLVFIYGAKFVLSMSFLSGTAAGAVVGKIASTLGVSGTYGAAGTIVGLAGRGAALTGRATGATAAYEAGKARLGQEKEDQLARLRGRFPILQTQEQTTAQMKARMGVRGAGEEYEKLMKQRIAGNRERITAPLKQELQKLENQASQAATPEEREEFQKQIKQLKSEQKDKLKDLLKSGNRDVALAASEVLLEDGNLTAEEMRQTGQRYAGISPVAVAEFIKRRDAALVKNAGKQEFDKDPDKAAQQVQDFLSLMSDKKQAEAYYKGLKNSKSKIAALKAGAKIGFEKGINDTTLTYEEALEREAPKFTSNDWLAIENSLPTELEDDYYTHLLRKNSKKEILHAAQKNPDQLARIQAAIGKAEEKREELLKKRKERRELGEFEGPQGQPAQEKTPPPEKAEGKSESKKS